MLMWEIYGNTKDDIWELCRENVDFSHILPTYSLVLHKEWSTTTCVTSTPEGVKFQARSLLLCYLTFFLHVLPRILYSSSLIWLNPTSDKTDLLHWIPENRTWAKASTFPQKSRLQKPQIIHLFSLSSFFLPSYKHTRGSNANAASAFPELSCHWVNLKFRGGGGEARPLRLLQQCC